jgi:hypothetical protein
MVPCFNGSNNPRSGVFWMVETPDFGNRFHFNDLPGSCVPNKVFGGVSSGTQFISRVRKRSPPPSRSTISNRVYDSAFLPTSVSHTWETSWLQTSGVVPIERLLPRK